MLTLLPIRPLALATDALRILQALAQRNAGPDEIQREVQATITGWPVEAVEELREQVALAIEVAAAEASSRERDDQAGLLAGMRQVVCLEAAYDALEDALACV